MKCRERKCEARLSTPADVLALTPARSASASCEKPAIVGLVLERFGEIWGSFHGLDSDLSDPAARSRAERKLFGALQADRSRHGRHGPARTPRRKPRRIGRIRRAMVALSPGVMPDSLVEKNE